MKSAILSALIPSVLALGSLTIRRDLVRRQAAEACPIGYCLENGGTTGGGAAAAVTVSTLASFKAAAAATGPAVIIVSGTISGSGTDRVDITSDKTVFGEAGSGEC